MSWRRAVRLICAGWLPQDGLFGWNLAAGLRVERGPCFGVAHRSVADRSSRCGSPPLWNPSDVLWVETLAGFSIGADERPGDEGVNVERAQRSEHERH